LPLNVGPSGALLIIVVALLLFGPSKLPQLGRAVGTTLREFRKGTRELVHDMETDQEDKRAHDAESQK
jgi:sec-independent protein translocase protein TatA